MTGNKVIACVCIFTCATGVAMLTDSDQQMLARAFASTNTPDQVAEVSYAMLSNCWFGTGSFNPLHSRELQYNLLTNACHFKSNDIEYWVLHSMRMRYDVFDMQTDYRCGTNDLEYLEQCADFLGREMMPAANRTNLHPRIVFNYNCMVKNNRRMMLRRYGKLVERYERLLDGVGEQVFRTNIIERARLTEEERRIIWPDAL